MNAAERMRSDSSGSVTAAGGLERADQQQEEADRALAGPLRIAVAEVSEAVRDYPVISLPKMLRETTHLRISLVPS